MPSSPLDKFDSLDKELSLLSKEEDKVATLLSYIQLNPSSIGFDLPSMRHFVSNSSSFSSHARVGTNVDTHSTFLDQLSALCKKYGLERQYPTVLLNALMQVTSSIANPSRGPIPIKRNPCANGIPALSKSCPNEGNLACAACRIVSYCSKECQKAHWKTHKSDCKDKIRAPDWKPDWVKEGREPSFMGGDIGYRGPDWVRRLDPVAQGQDLWGSIPAYDVINLSKNEDDVKSDLGIAFVASGDIRNALRSVNALPDNYSGHLTMLLNDHNPAIVTRNLILLVILALVADSSVAAELALHFWYSAWLPEEYLEQIFATQAVMAECFALEDSALNIAFGAQSTIMGKFERGTMMDLPWQLSSRHELQKANREIERVRFAEHRKDRHDRYSFRLEPSHRLGYLEYRRFDLVLPFGARNDHFSTPNQTLFSPDGKWVQDDLVDPLSCWNAKDVVAAGQIHGAQRADLYGCLYFYLFDELLKFANRIRRFHVTFQLFDQDTVTLSNQIRSGEFSKLGIPPSIQFDRIDVSNMGDVAYVGLAKIILTWGPFLKRTKHATLIEHFMSWVMGRKGADVNGMTEEQMASIMTKMVDDKRMPSPPSHSPQAVREYVGILPGYYNSFTAYIENSQPFRKYLHEDGIKGALRSTNLKLKEWHSVVPHRLYAPLEAPANALPYFPDEESWYLQACVGRALLSERFIELCPNQDL